MVEIGNRAWRGTVMTVAARGSRHTISAARAV
jgi:hypothetical protein